MTNKTTEALKLAEEALIKANHFHDYEDELAAIRKALAEPVTISCDCGDIYERNSFGGKFIQQYGCCPNCDAAQPVNQPTFKLTTGSAVYAAEPVKQEPVAGLFLGGIVDGEYGECEVDPYERVIEALQKRLVKDGNAVYLELYATPLDAKAIRAEALEEANDLLDKIEAWAKAYPVSVFPEPDFAKAHKVLTENGMTLDAISASNMRHVLTQLQKMIDDCAAAIRGLK